MCCAFSSYLCRLVQQSPNFWARYNSQFHTLAAFFQNSNALDWNWGLTQSWTPFLKTKNPNYSLNFRSPYFPFSLSHTHTHTRTLFISLSRFTHAHTWLNTCGQNAFIKKSQALTVQPVKTNIQKLFCRVFILINVGFGASCQLIWAILTINFNLAVFPYNYRHDLLVILTSGSQVEMFIGSKPLLFFAKK